MPLTIGDLRRIISALPDDLPVVASDAYGIGQDLDAPLVREVLSNSDEHQQTYPALVFNLVYYGEYPE